MTHYTSFVAVEERIVANADDPLRTLAVAVPLPEGDWKVIQGNGFAGSLEKAGIYLPPAQALFAEATKNER